MLNLLNMTTFQGYLFTEGSYKALEFYIYVYKSKTSYRVSRKKEPAYVLRATCYHVKKNIRL